MASDDESDTPAPAATTSSGEPDAATLARGVYKDAVAIMMQDSNGDNVFSNERALYGYVTSAEYLVVPHAFHQNAGNKVTINGAVKDIPKVTLKEFGGLKNIRPKLASGGNQYRSETAYLYYPDQLLFTKIALMNFKKLIDGGVNEKAAFAVASLRARWCVLGAYNVAKEDGNKPFEEVAVYGDPSTFATGRTPFDNMAVAVTLSDLLGVDIALSRRYMKFVQADDIGAIWVTGISETLWASEEYIVRVRGHHYKDEYAINLLKFCEACFEGDDRIPKDIALAVLFRTSIHAFGLRALPIMAGHFAIWGKLGNAALIRFSGAPNGMAVVTTTAAAIRSMASEPWYGVFEETYKAQLKKLHAFESAVLSNKFGFHQSAGIYGETSASTCEVDGVTYTIEQMKATGGVMAAIGQGFIEAMRAAVESKTISSFAFSKAKSLEKHAGNAPLTTLRIKTLIIYSIESVANSKNVNAAIAAAIPETKKAIKEAGEVTEVE